MSKVTPFQCQFLLAFAALKHAKGVPQMASPARAELSEAIRALNVLENVTFLSNCLGPFRNLNLQTVTHHFVFLLFTKFTRVILFKSENMEKSHP